MAEPHDPIRSLVFWEPSFAAREVSLRSIARALTDEEVGALLLETPGGGFGVLSERDVVAALAEGADPDEVWGDDIVTVDVRVADPDDAIVDVALQMLDANVRHIVVVDGRLPVGVVSMRDVLRTLVDAALTMRPAS